MWGAHNTALIEKQGVPAVLVVDQPFVEDVKVTLEKVGMPAVRSVVVPHPCGDIPDDQYAKYIPKLVAALTAPLTEEEKKTGEIVPRKPPRIALSGTLDEVQSYFLAHHWSDGLPIIPPTEARVKEMLKGTSHAADEVVTSNMLPEGWTATVEKAAIVGVMAGCKPAYMPVLLAMVEAFGKSLFQTNVRSTNSFTNMTLVNGPIRNEIGMNAGINALGPCNQANATIGRFLKMAIINLGGSWPGISDLGSQGSPTKYNFCFPENEERSPWEPFHVSLGFKREESTVSIFYNGLAHFGNFSDLDHMAKGIKFFDRLASGLRTNGVAILMDPMVAKSLSAKGMSKKDVEDYVWSHSTLTLGELKKDIRMFAHDDFKLVLQRKEYDDGVYKQRDGQTYVWPQSYVDLPDDAIVSSWPRHHIKVIVVGGETNPMAQTWSLGAPSMVGVDKWR